MNKHHEFKMKITTISPQIKIHQIRSWQTTIVHPAMKTAILAQARIYCKAGFLHFFLPQIP
jgi:hypothetical protein